MSRRVSVKQKKSILIEGIDEDLYFRLLMLKAKLKARTWNDFIQKVVRILERM